MSDHRKLEVWRRARRLCREIYHLVNALPANERLRRGDQLIRAATSVRHNIAEGASLGTDAKYRERVMTSIGSANEVWDELDELANVGLLRESDRWLLDETIEIAKMLAGLAQYLEREIARETAKRSAARRRAAVKRRK